MLSAESRLLPPFWVGWMSMACVSVCTVHVRVHIGVWTLDAACVWFLQTCGVCVLTVCPSVIPRDWSHLAVVLPWWWFLWSVFAIKQHHSLIFNNLLNQFHGEVLIMCVIVIEMNLCHSFSTLKSVSMWVTGNIFSPSASQCELER